MATNRINANPPVTTYPSRPADPASTPTTGQGQQAVTDTVGQLTSDLVASEARKPTKPSSSTTTTTGSGQGGTTQTSTTTTTTTTTTPTTGTTQPPVTQPETQTATDDERMQAVHDYMMNWKPTALPFKMPQIGTDLASSGGFEEPFGGKKEKTEEEEKEDAEKGGPSQF